MRISSTTRSGQRRVAAFSADKAYAYRTVVLVTALLCSAQAQAQVITGPTIGTATPVTGTAIGTPTPAPGVPPPPAAEVTVAGIANTAVATMATPPDPVGDVGPNHYVQASNFPAGPVLQIFDKNLNTLLATVNIQALVPAAGAGACATAFSDPIVVYDQLANRWVVMDINFGNMCVYLSTGADPRGAWRLYNFNMATMTDTAGNPAPGPLPDYPKLTVWPNAYYVGTNDGNGVATSAYALDRTRMLAGNPAGMIAFSVGAFTTGAALGSADRQRLIPADIEGAALPPLAAAEPGLFLKPRDNETYSGANTPPTACPGGGGPGSCDFLEIYSFAPNFTTPANSTFTLLQDLPVAEFTQFLNCGASTRSCVPQPGTIVGLDALAHLAMWRLTYRNFGGREVLVGNVTANANVAQNVSGIFWFELNQTDPAAWSVANSGIFNPGDGQSRWMGSIASDADGNLALGYSISGAGANQFPGMAYVGRLATDPPNTMGATVGEVLLIRGSGVQTTNRWGDYSSMNVDPVDNCTFYYTNELYPVTSPDQWSTSISTLRLPGCPVPTTVAEITGTATALPFPAGNLQSFQISINSNQVINLATATVTINELLSQVDAIGGGNNLLGGLPVVLAPLPGSTPNLGLYASLGFPSVSLQILRVATGYVITLSSFTATIARPPSCGLLFGSANLRSRITIDGTNAGIVAVGMDTWLCFGPQLVNF